MTTGEYVSDLLKYRWHAFADTFDPVLLTRLLTWPLSTLVASRLVEGDKPEGTGHLTQRVVLVLGMGLAEAAVLAVVVAVVAEVARRRMRRRRSKR